MNVFEKLHINNRKVACIKDIEEFEEIDYKNVNFFLKKEVDKAWKFLVQACK